MIKRALALLLLAPAAYAADITTNPYVTCSGGLGTPNKYCLAEENLILGVQGAENTIVTTTDGVALVSVPSIGVETITAGDNITITGSATAPIISAADGSGVTPPPIFVSGSVPYMDTATSLQNSALMYGGGQLDFMPPNATEALSIYYDDTDTWYEISVPSTGDNFGLQIGADVLWLLAREDLVIQGSPARYLADYSASYTDRSLPDVAYVDGQLGNYMPLGGGASVNGWAHTITGNGSITHSGAGNYSHIISQGNYSTTVGVGGWSALASGAVSLTSTGGPLNLGGTTIGMYGAYTFPAVLGNSGQVLTIPASGTALAWADSATGGNPVASGTNITIDNVTTPGTSIISTLDNNLIFEAASATDVFFTFNDNLSAGAGFVAIDANDNLNINAVRADLELSSSLGDVTFKTSGSTVSRFTYDPTNLNAVLDVTNRGFAFNLNSAPADAYLEFGYSGGSARYEISSDAGLAILSGDSSNVEITASEDLILIAPDGITVEHQTNTENYHEAINLDGDFDTGTSENTIWHSLVVPAFEPTGGGDIAIGPQGLHVAASEDASSWERVATYDPGQTDAAIASMDPSAGVSYNPSEIIYVSKDRAELYTEDSDDFTIRSGKNLGLVSDVLTTLTSGGATQITAGTSLVLSGNQTAQVSSLVGVAASAQTANSAAVSLNAFGPDLVAQQFGVGAPTSVPPGGLGYIYADVTDPDAILYYQAQGLTPNDWVSYFNFGFQTALYPWAGSPVDSLVTNEPYVYALTDLGLWFRNSATPGSSEGWEQVGGGGDTGTAGVIPYFGLDGKITDSGLSYSGAFSPTLSATAPGEDLYIRQNPNGAGGLVFGATDSLSAIGAVDFYATDFSISSAASSTISVGGNLTWGVAGDATINAGTVNMPGDVLLSGPGTMTTVYSETNANGLRFINGDGSVTLDEFYAPSNTAAGQDFKLTRNGTGASERLVDPNGSIFFSVDNSTREAVLEVSNTDQTVRAKSLELESGALKKYQLISTTVVPIVDVPTSGYIGFAESFVNSDYTLTNDVLGDLVTINTAGTYCTQGMVQFSGPAAEIPVSPGYMTVLFEVDLEGVSVAGGTTLALENQGLSSVIIAEQCFTADVNDVLTFIISQRTPLSELAGFNAVYTSITLERQP